MRRLEVSASGPSSTREDLYMLEVYREDLENWLGLFELFVEEDKNQLQPYWLKLKPKIDNWWKAYKTREANDTFDKALAGERMTARAFGGTKGFEGALTQRIKPCEFSLTKSHSSGWGLRYFETGWLRCS
jgi:hypothetical protein